jgi:hypothetical protein
MVEGDHGPLDWEKTGRAAQIFEDRLDGLVKSVQYIPDTLKPRAVMVELYDGIQADSSRFEIQWWEHHGYKYHYIEDGLEFRFGWERGDPDLPDKHFHPPEALGTHEPSCIEHEEPLLVTLAVIKCWLDAARSGDPSVLNQQVNPP